MRSDGIATKELILEIAGKFFAEKGYDSTTSKEICLKANANPAAINYHFGGKMQLYQATLIKAHAHLIALDHLQHIQKMSISPEEKLGLFIDSFVINVSKGGWYAKILIREILSPSKRFEQMIKQVVVQEMFPKIAIAKKIISEITGLPVNNPAVLRSLYTIGTPCIMLLVAQKTILEHLYQDSIQDMDALTQHLKTYALGGLKNVARQYNKR